MILFAFAGNMDVEEFAKIVPSAKKIDIAKLPGYTFLFNKTAEDQSSKANITPSNDDAVWGVLIELNDDEKGNFYNGETWSIDFKLEPVNCIATNNKVYAAHAFVAQPHAVNTHLLPYDWYQQKVIALAKNAGLPEEYIAKISTMPVKIDPDDARRQRRLKKL